MKLDSAENIVGIYQEHGSMKSRNCMIEFGKKNTMQ